MCVVNCATQGATSFDPDKHTGRQLRRANTIIDLVRQHQVVDDPRKLYKVIHVSSNASLYVENG